jgi:amino-acid N-acetyltransferase
VQRGIQRLVLLTTRTADWFEQRGFKPAGAAHVSAMLPEDRRRRIDPSRNSQLFSKQVAGAEL